MFCAAIKGDKLFQIDRTQESCQYITDISSEDLYILDPADKYQHSIGSPAEGAAYGSSIKEALLRHKDEESLKIPTPDIAPVSPPSTAKLKRLVRQQSNEESGSGSETCSKPARQLRPIDKSTLHLSPPMRVFC